MSGWQERPLGQVVTLQRGFDITQADQTNGIYPVVSSSGIRSFHNEWQVRGPGVVIGRKGTLGSVFYLANDFWPHDTTLWVKDFHGNVPLFVFYYLKSRDLGAYDVGSSNPTLNRNHVHLLSACVPSPEEQKVIAAVLSSLDDKIDLLHRQNKTLEAMAETLFHQWFVEEAGSDWEAGALSKYVNIGIGRTPPRNQHQWFSEDAVDIKWISIKDLGSEGLYSFDTSEYLTREAVAKFNIPVIPENTVVLSFKMTVGRVAITTEQMLSNEAIAHFKFKPDTPFTVEYLYLYLKSYKYEMLGSTSSIVTAINSTMIKAMEITIPERSLMKRFDETAKEMFKKIRGNQLQIRTLETLRDTLLPKLMSGEVRVEV